MAAHPERPLHTKNQWEKQWQADDVVQIALRKRTTDMMWLQNPPIDREQADRAEADGVEPVEE